MVRTARHDPARLLEIVDEARDMGVSREDLAQACQVRERQIYRALDGTVVSEQLVARMIGCINRRTGKKIDWRSLLREEYCA